MIQKRLFNDTENPVCLAIFNKDKVKDTDIFVDDKYIGQLSKIRQLIPRRNSSKITFNVKKGDLGLVAIDNTKKPSIGFCEGQELKGYNISNSSRFVTRISIEGVRVQDALILKLNNELNNFRLKTYDIFMTPFKGVRADGFYRRRLDYSLARKLIAENL